MSAIFLKVGSKSWVGPKLFNLTVGLYCFQNFILVTQPATKQDQLTP